MKGLCPTFALCGEAEPMKLELIFKLSINNNGGYKETCLALCGIPSLGCDLVPSIIQAFRPRLVGGNGTANLRDTS